MDRMFPFGFTYESAAVRRPSSGNILRAGTMVNVRFPDGEWGGAQLVEDVAVRETGHMTYVALGPMTVSVLRHHLPVGTAISRVASG